jgi:hypothetical protein
MAFLSNTWCANKRKPKRQHTSHLFVMTPIPKSLVHSKHDQFPPQQAQQTNHRSRYIQLADISKSLHNVHNHRASNFSITDNDTQVHTVSRYINQLSSEKEIAVLLQSVQNEKNSLYFG